MGKIINMQQSEYDTVAEKLKTLHEEQLQVMDTIAQEIRSLCEMEGGFYVEKVSQKANKMMDSLQNEVMTKMQMAFTASEIGMDTLMNSICNIDSACN